MPRLIDANKMREDWLENGENEYVYDTNAVLESIDAQPTVYAVEVSDDDFGAVLNCAVRYAIGRQTYMPSLVLGYITPLIPRLSDKTLWCFNKDIAEQKRLCYGDPMIDEPLWMKFHEAVRAERTKRGEELYKNWRDNE